MRPHQLATRVHWVAGASPGDQTIAPASAMQVRAACQSHGVVPVVSSPIPPAGASNLHLLRRVGVVDPTSLDAYRAHGGYAALRRALDLGPEGVLREVNDSKLLGRGGAAFPTGRKWEAVAQAPVQPHYLICNADESEPGTFKDRILMEADPFAVIEAMTIAALATGCTQGYLYIRGEYPEAQHRLTTAIAQARARGFLGPQVMGQAFQFDIELRRGAGAYICGEETALMNSIEGYRGEPRNKPPFPVQVGLFGKPTVVNNVETLVNVLDIVIHGGLAFAARGTPDATGSKLFCLSGCVTRPGLYEVPFGVTLRELLTLAGGVRGGRSLQAVLLGGAAGTFVFPEQLDTPLTFAGVRAIGASLGSGVVMVLDETIDVQAILLRIAAFFRDESCGQCVALSGRHGAPGGNAAAAVHRTHPGDTPRRIGTACRAWAGHAGCLDLWTGAHGRECYRLGAAEAATLSLSEAPMTAATTDAARRSLSLTIDGQAVCVPEGTTLLEACRMQGIATPTLCYLENLRPVNVCRVCVVEVEGSRALSPGLFASG